jgi:hypothetical protein
MLRGLLFFLLLVGLSAGAAHAEQRVALLLGNSAYPDAPLDNPSNDVALLEQTLMWRRPLLSAELWPITFERFQEIVDVSRRWRRADPLEARSLFHGLTATSWEV